MSHGIRPPLMLLLILLALPCAPLYAGTHEGHQHSMHAGAADRSGAPMEFAAMPDPGEKVPMGGGAYLIYGFDRRPKLGMVILKVEVYTRDGERDTSLEVLGDSGMPSMRGAHETGDQPFQLSRKGDYLLPVNIVMLGDWEVRLTVKKNGKVLFRGSHRFDI